MHDNLQAAWTMLGKGAEAASESLKVDCEWIVEVVSEE
jgi:hypothetical protein